MSNGMKCSALNALSEAILAHGHFDDSQVSDAVTELIKAMDADLDGLGYEPSDITEAKAGDLDEAVIEADSRLDEKDKDDDEEEDPPAGEPKTSF